MYENNDCIKTENDSCAQKNQKIERRTCKNSERCFIYGYERNFTANPHKCYVEKEGSEKQSDNEESVPGLSVDTEFNIYNLQTKKKLNLNTEMKWKKWDE